MTQWMDAEGWRGVTAVLTIVVGWLGGRLGRAFLQRFATGLERHARPISAAAARSLMPVATLVGVLIGARIALGVLTLSPAASHAAETAFGVALALLVGFTAYRYVDVALAALHRRASAGSRMDSMIAPVIGTTLRIVVILLTVLQVVQMLTDKPMTSLLAGLGVGGLAVALAAQDTLKNFFGSVVLSIDRPFEVGDRIQVDGIDGPVELVGFRSTRIRTLDGHLVTIPNGDLAAKTIVNVGRRPRIRRILNLSLTYNTAPAKIERAIAIVQEILRDHEGMQPDFPPRVHFNQFAADYLNLEVIYWYHPPDWWRACAFAQRVNLEILRRFNAEGIEFAFPTRTLVVAGHPDQPLRVETAPAPR
jgi:MscS family membrane protein